MLQRSRLTMNKGRPFDGFCGRRSCPQATLRELEEGAGPMREPGAAWRQAVLFLARHFAEGAAVAIGQEHRVVAEALRSARRPDERAVDARLELLDMAVGPRDAERRDEMPLA